MRQSVLNMLVQHSDEWLSGQWLAEQAGVSRAAIWKEIKKLRDEGILIDAMTRKGYRLASADTVFCSDSVQKFLSKDTPYRFEFHSCIDSTNMRAQTLANEGAPEWTVVIANSQTAGRGRRGRSFYSPKQHGLYLSIIVRPTLLAKEVTLLTIAAAVAVAEACEQISGQQCAIKWVNDIYLRNRKISGILTEGALSFEDQHMQWAVVGIGVNLTVSQDTPEELRNIIGGLYETQPADPFLRSRLTAEILKRFYQYAKKLSDRTYLSAYRQRLFILNQKVRLISMKEERTVTAKDIDKDGHLIIENENGECEIISSGEVSLRIE